MSARARHGAWFRQTDEEAREALKVIGVLKKDQSLDEMLQEIEDETMIECIFGPSPLQSSAFLNMLRLARSADMLRGLGFEISKEDLEPKMSSYAAVVTRGLRG